MCYQLFSELRGSGAWESGVDMSHEDDDTVYCNVQMSLASGKELLQLVTALRDSGSHPNLDTVLLVCNLS
jgi:hypothetical protein